MRSRKTLLTLAAVLAAATILSAAAPEARARRTDRPLIQLALLLDTSNSMDGLIDQAKSQLWKVVNELATAKRDGKTPELEVALYEYGNSGLSASGGYIRQVLPLTRDLDRVSEKLFALTTNGGSEHCGQVIARAVRDLEWSRRSKDLKLIYIAGNEEFTQGPVDYRDAAKGAIERGIMVNTIHCGDFTTGVRGKWQHGAMLADGTYMVIDQDRAVVHIDAPQDDEIARLGLELNRTYIAYGSGGEAGLTRQAEQDGNAEEAAPGSSVQRSLFKAKRQYTNPVWDLVDRFLESPDAIDDVAAADLPEEMRTMSKTERKKHVEKKLAERERIQTRIQALEKERRTYVDKKRAEAADGPDTLDSAMLKSLRVQATKLDFEFSE